MCVSALYVHLCGCVCGSAHQGAQTKCGFLSCKSTALGGAVNKRFSVSPRWKVPLLIRRATGLRERAGERERERIESGGGGTAGFHRADG